MQGVFAIALTMMMVVVEGKMCTITSNCNAEKWAEVKAAEFADSGFGFGRKVGENDVYYICDICPRKVSSLHNDEKWKGKFHRGSVVVEPTKDEREGAKNGVFGDTIFVHGCREPNNFGLCSTKWGCMENVATAELTKKCRGGTGEEKPVKVLRNT